MKGLNMAKSGAVSTGVRIGSFGPSISRVGLPATGRPGFTSVKLFGQVPSRLISAKGSARGPEAGRGYTPTAKEARTLGRGFFEGPKKPSSIKTREFARSIRSRIEFSLLRPRTARLNTLPERGGQRFEVRKTPPKASRYEGRVRVLEPGDVNELFLSQLDQITGNRVSVANPPEAPKPEDKSKEKRKVQSYSTSKVETKSAEPKKDSKEQAEKDAATAELAKLGVNIETSNDEVAADKIALKIGEDADAVLAKKTEATLKQAVGEKRAAKLVAQAKERSAQSRVRTRSHASPEPQLQPALQAQAEAQRQVQTQARLLLQPLVDNGLDPKVADQAAAKAVSQAKATPQTQVQVEIVAGQQTEVATERRSVTETRQSESTQREKQEIRYQVDEAAQAMVAADAYRVLEELYKEKENSPDPKITGQEFADRILPDLYHPSRESHILAQLGIQGPDGRLDDTVKRFRSVQDMNYKESLVIIGEIPAVELEAGRKTQAVGAEAVERVLDQNATEKVQTHEDGILETTNRTPYQITIERVIAQTSETAETVDEVAAQQANEAKSRRVLVLEVGGLPLQANDLANTKPSNLVVFPTPLTQKLAA